MNILLINRNIEEIKKFLGKIDFSTRLPYGTKKFREIYFSMVNTKQITTQAMIDKLQSLKGQTKFEKTRNISKYYDEMNYMRQTG